MVDWKMVDQPADCPEAEARHGQTGGCGCSNLPIVLKPKPATVRLVVVVDSSGWMIEVDVVHRRLIVQSADCPEAKARYGQTGGWDCSKWLMRMGGDRRLIDQPADCPEAEARHGQTGEFVDQSADCPEAVKPATVRLVDTADCPEAIKPATVRLVDTADCPEAVKPATARLVNLVLEAGDRSGCLKWLSLDCRLS
ncbi:hypothetical protein ACN42_g11967 [Penicillium freii]|uniref:Uncharacterized protein n=1 Tax=Penicillium freii TaxID=48697 RepID=A0A101M7F9_PENFR|nr:hypothetical protein ACN42_g11967 [Penicillium freii]